MDGLPLAIGMAAAQIATLGPIELDARIESQFRRGTDPLAPSVRRGEPRHRTLQAVIEWSRVLLSPAERAAFADWTVFAGSVTADDAMAVLGVEPKAVDVLAARSLLSVSTERGCTRYRMLRTVRAVAAEPDYDPAPVAMRHAEHFAAVAADADRGLRTAGEAVASTRIEKTLDEFRAAHDWARAHDAQLAARLSRSLYLYGVSRLSGQVLDWGARLAPVTAPDPGLSALVDASMAIAW